MEGEGFCCLIWTMWRVSVNRLELPAAREILIQRSLSQWSVLRRSDMSSIQCHVCSHACMIDEGMTGMCRARKNMNGKNACANYGRLTSLSMDPIEKKPFALYYPGSMILSCGSYGCNLSCPFCQNSSISMKNENSVEWRAFTAEELCRYVLNTKNNLGLAFTYNEPMISYEFIIDCAKILKPLGKKIVIVTNGNISPEIMKLLMPYIDAMNIDLKGGRDFYRELNGDYDLVRNTIAYVYDKCHLEVTTLVIPEKNDSDAFIRKEASFLSSLDRNIPYHLSRYFPRYHYTEPATPTETIYRLQNIAEEYLNHVYTGNL
jgi:pyruvate formate lyase activating enzyme